MRKQLRDDALLGFVAFFTFLAVIQAALNAASASPEVWPAVFALIMVIALVIVWRWRR
ncbi:hypothetical protein QVA66_06320 [Staphylococcus chromogenes]|nr:hypothetical protein [Staphylococcus chromogenes]